MSRQNVRTGEPVNLNTGSFVTTAGTTGASARVLTFNGDGTNRYIRPLILQNLDGTNAVFIKLNDNDATASDCHFRLGANERVLVDWVNVTKISAFMSAGVYTTLMVHGWTP